MYSETTSLPPWLHITSQAKHLYTNKTVLYIV
jgi:hypothetical protein